MNELLLTALTSLVAGLVTGFVLFVILRRTLLQRAQAEAQQILDTVKDEVELLEIDQKEQQAEIENELWGRVETEIAELETTLTDLEEESTDLKKKRDDQYSQIRGRVVELEKWVKDRSEIFQTLEEERKKKLQQFKQTQENFINKLSETFGLKKSVLLEQEITRLIEEATQDGRKKIYETEEQTKLWAETQAKHILDRVLVRFQRAYSSERGIPAVYLTEPNQADVIFDPERKNLQLLQELTGCDIYYEAGFEFIGVSGFDPVRRELTRRVLERCLKEKKLINEAFIRKTFDNIQRELMSLIKKDGDQLMKELRLENVHPEIRQIMGALRYRYSFTQNQYFHCGEVGWLCGLLAEELGTVNNRKARRAGVLHDLGKALDHLEEGGHAVIGANFIAARKEAADIVHAVKAHHFDETPATDLAYLVIAADAISGARPGARRSTMESYNQKVTELERISKSYPGVVDCFVLNGGRECRVIVNGRKVDDRAALELTKKIAAQIEAECNYPGQIKVVTVRETMATETTRGHQY